jgi:molecular chaperone GrpE
VQDKKEELDEVVAETAQETAQESVEEKTTTQEPDSEVVDETKNETKVDELETLKLENKDLTEKLLRLQADFDNYRRRTVKEQGELSGFVTANVVGKFLKVFDNFERAIDSNKKATDPETIRVGMEKIERQFAQALTDLKVEEIPAHGEKFNPEYHEALMKGANPELEDDTIDAVFEKGYKLEDRIIRPSKVKVVAND